MQHMNPYTVDAYQLLHEGGLALSRCEQHGMRVNEKYIVKQQKKVNQKIKKLESEFKDTPFYRRWRKSVKLGDINIYSDDQLRDFVYNVEGHKVEKRTDKGNPSIDAEALQSLNEPDLVPYLKIAKLKPLIDTFLSSLLRESVNGIVHPFFHLHLPISYRGSSSDPNFQNFPKRDEQQMNVIRGAIFPSKGNQLLELDYSQLEVRIAATYHRDPRMRKEIETGHDFHKDLAEEIFMIKYDKTNKQHKVLRAAAKNGFVFPAFYGDYHVGFANSLSSVKWANLPKHNKWSKKDGIEFGKKNIAAHLIKNGIDHLGLPTKDSRASGFTKHLQDIENNFWQNRYTIYAKWKDDWYADYLEKGYFYNKTGFTFQGVMNKKDCINYPVQSSAFHILLWSLKELSKALRVEKMRTKIIGQIHDAIVFDIYPPELDKVIKIAKCIMIHDVKQHWNWIDIPLEIEAELCPINAAWSKKEDYKIN